jgi:hypothetical protein
MLCSSIDHISSQHTAMPKSVISINGNGDRHGGINAETCTNNEQHNRLTLACLGKIDHDPNWQLQALQGCQMKEAGGD